MKVKGVIFDFGFTLFYFEKPSIEKYFECFKKGLLSSIEILKTQKILKEPIAVKEFIRIFDRKRSSSFKKSIKTKIEIPTSKIFQNVLKIMNDKNPISDFNVLNDQFYMKLANTYHSCEEDEWYPFKNTRETLERLVLKNIKIALISNHPNHKTIENVLNKHKILQYFDAIVTSAKFGKRKPDPNIFYHTLKKLGLESHANSVIMCGDEYADIIGATRANIHAVLIERNYKFPFEKEINISNYTKVNDISEILNLIE